MATDSMERFGEGMQPDVDSGHQHQRTRVGSNGCGGRSIHGTCDPWGQGGLLDCCAGALASNTSTDFFDFFSNRENEGGEGRAKKQFTESPQARGALRTHTCV